MELKHIITMVKERNRRTHLKYRPTYRYGTHWPSDIKEDLELIKFLHNNKDVKMIKV